MYFPACLNGHGSAMCDAPAMPDAIDSGSLVGKLVALDPYVGADP